MKRTSPRALYRVLLADIRSGISNSIGDPLDHTYPSLSHVPDADWKLLGVIDLPVIAGAHSEADAQLIILLGTLNLPAEFQNKILHSAREVVTRLTQRRGDAPDHIHLVLLIPAGGVKKSGTWGFFRIEKVEEARADGKNPDHAVEFYMYEEGS